MKPGYFLRDGTLPLVCGVLALMVGWGVFVGLAQASLRDRMTAEVVEHEQEAQQKNGETLQSVLAGKEVLVPFSNPANPAALAGSLSGRHAVLPNAPLAPLAVGQSDMMPNYYRITYLSKVQFMYDSGNRKSLEFAQRAFRPRLRDRIRVAPSHHRAGI